MIDFLKGFVSREFLTTAAVLAALVILALNDKLTPELTAALTGTNGVYVWSRTRVKQENGGDKMLKIKASASSLKKLKE